MLVENRDHSKQNIQEKSLNLAPSFRKSQIVGGKNNLQISTGWPSEVCPDQLDLTKSGEAGVMTSLYPAPSAVPAKLQGEKLAAIFGDGFPQTLSLLAANAREIVLSNIVSGPVSKITIRPISSASVSVNTPFKESSYMLFEQTNTMRNQVIISAKCIRAVPILTRFYESHSFLSPSNNRMSRLPLAALPSLKISWLLPFS